MFELGTILPNQYSAARRELSARGLRADHYMAHGSVCDTYHIKMGSVVGSMQAEHPGIELVRSSSPHTRRLSAKTYSLRPHQIMVFNGLESHTEVYEGRVEERQSVVINPAIIDSAISPLGGRSESLFFSEVLAERPNIQLDVLFTDLFECRNNLEHDPFSSECISTALVLELLHGRKNSYSEKIKQLSSQGRFPGFVSRAKKILVEHYSDTDLSLEKISKTCGVSKFHFLRVFKQQTGLTPAQFLQTFRINQSCNRLLNPKKSIQEIALETGFADLSNFYRQFKRRTGMTPVQFRKQRNLGSNE